MLQEEHTQYPEKLNVWAGILGNGIIGPVFIDGNSNGERYLQMLETVIEPLIIEALENQRGADGNPYLNENLLHFQQDGAPAHYVLPVRQWLDNRYPNQWIGRRGPIEWPPRSLGLFSVGSFEVSRLQKSTGVN